MSLKNTALLYDRITIQPEALRLLPERVLRILDLGGGQGGNGAIVKEISGADFLCLADLNDSALAHAPAAVDACIMCDVGAEQAIEGVFRRHGPFDLVLLLDVLEHLYDPWRLIARLHALLDMGGYVLASIPNIQNYRTVIRAATGTWRYRDIGVFDRTHLRFFSRRSAIDLMTCSGLSMAGIKRGYGSKSRDRLLDRFSLGLLGPFVTLQYQILVRKDTNEIVDPGFCGSAGPTA